MNTWKIQWKNQWKKTLALGCAAFLLGGSAWGYAAPTVTAASTMVFYSLDYSMSNYEQCRARIHRAGQKFPCTYIHLIAKGTVVGKVMQALKNKANLARTLIDDWRKGNNPFEE